MGKFRKKIITIEAERWLKVTYDREAGHGIEEKDMPIYHFEVGYYRRPDVSGDTKCPECEDIMHNHGWIDTPEGGHTVCPGDWVIDGDYGYYPCKPDFFEKTYEEITEG